MTDPELYEPVLIVNAPSWIAVAWNLFKPLIPPETLKKISIVGSHAALETLRRYVGMDQIPTHLGGERTEATASKWPPYPRAEKVS